MMKVMNETPGRLAVWLLAVLWCVGAAPAWAQDRFVTVDYMKVAPGQGDAYLQLEQKLWKPVHEARVKAAETPSVGTCTRFFLPVAAKPITTT